MTLRRAPGLISIAGPIPPAAIHAHHAMQITVARAGAIWFGDRRCASVLIDADVAHALHADDALTLLIEPESHLCADLRIRLLRGSPSRVDLPLSVESDPTVENLLSQLSQPNPCFARHLDPRIEATLAWLDTLALEGRWTEVSLAAALTLTGLSQGRFLHLFKAQTGVPWRPMLVWRRAQVAMTYAAQGMSLTSAAHAAGYADSAHLSRQFKAMFGRPPSAVLEGLESEVESG